MRPPKRLWLPSMARNPWCRPACMSASLVLWLAHRTPPLYSSLTVSPLASLHVSWPRAQCSCLLSAANIHFCDITAAGIRLRAAVTGRLLLDINQGTFLQIWPVSSQLRLQRNDLIKININISLCLLPIFKQFKPARKGGRNWNVLFSKV